MDVAAELQKIYDSEINVEVSWLWDGGIDVRVGDRLNGYVAETNVALAADIIPWLQGGHSAFLSRFNVCHGLANGGQAVRSAPDLRSANGGRARNVSALRSAKS